MNAPLEAHAASAVQPPDGAPGKKRIWEIDALRGFLILCVVAAHALFCGEYMLGLYRLPKWLDVILFQHAGSIFVVLSGLSATLGNRSFKRGLIVFGCGMLLTLGSMLGVRLGLLSEDLIIRFGVLHLLGLCMMLYPLLKRLSGPALAGFGTVVLLLGYWFATRTVSVEFLFPLGLCAPGFSSGDYFPVCPQLGWFCLGALLGRRLYPEKRTLLPSVNENLWILRFLRFCGRHSLVFFVLHLPVVGGVMYGLALLLGKL